MPAVEEGRESLQWHPRTATGCSITCTYDAVWNIFTAAPVFPVVIVLRSFATPESPCTSLLADPHIHLPTVSVINVVTLVLCTLRQDLDSRITTLCAVVAILSNHTMHAFFPIVLLTSCAFCLLHRLQLGIRVRICLVLCKCLGISHET